MFNIMLDPVPEDWEGYPINSDFRVGIQVHQIMEDTELTKEEKYLKAMDLIFPGVRPDIEDQIRAISWFLSGWNHDNHKGEKDSIRVIDYDIDQWRLYSAFKAQYGIDLNKDDMHYWQFMGLLTTLDECAFTRVVDIRMKKITSKMPKEEKAATLRAKKIYGLDQRQETEEQKQKQQEAIEIFKKMRKTNF